MYKTSISLTPGARQWSEYSADVRDQNRKLWFAVFALVVVAFALMFMVVSMFRANIGREPFVVRVWPDGRPEAIAANEMAYIPKENEVKYFLGNWAMDFYSRVHAQVRERQTNAARFFSKPIAAAEMKNSVKDVTEFLKSDNSNTVEVEVKNVIVRDLVQSPYKADIVLKKRIWTPAKELVKEEDWTVNLRFISTGVVPNELVQHNPLGFLITYLQAYQGF